MTISSRSLKYTAFLGAAFLALGLTAMLFVPRARAVTSLADIESGDLVRGESLSAVYYMGADGFRYVFPNDKCYFTWYSNFDDVKWISDSDLAKIQLGGNVTYKPQAKMVKIVSSPNVYAVGENGTIHNITSESLAAAGYGSDWNTKIDDIADAFFSNYTKGSDFTDEADFATLMTGHDYTINTDKSLTSPAEISVSSSSFSPTTVTIAAGATVRFTNNDTSSHTVLADDNSWGSIIAAGSTFVKRFSTAGTYTFYDSDSDATGAIVVE